MGTRPWNFRIKASERAFLFSIILTASSSKVWQNCPSFFTFAKQSLPGYPKILEMVHIRKELLSSS